MSKPVNALQWRQERAEMLQSRIEHATRIRTILELRDVGMVAVEDGDMVGAVVFIFECLGIEPEDGWPEGRTLTDHVTDLLAAERSDVDALIEESYRPSYPVGVYR